MSLGLVSPILNRGVRSRWLASLPGAGSKMLTIDSNGDTSFQDIPVAAWGSITGTLSAQTDLQSALDGKLSLTGGTLTGAVTSNLGTITASTPALTINQTWNDAAVNFSLINGSITPTAASGSYWFNFTSTSNWGAGGSPFFRASARDGAIEISSMWGQGSLLLGSHAIRLEGIYGTGFVIKDYTGNAIANINTEYSDTGIQAERAAMPIGWSGLKLRRDAADTLALQRSTNAQRFNLYGTYTDASNYRRLYLSSTTAGAFTIGVEGAGTGASGNTLTVASPLTITGYPSSSIGLTIQATPSVNVDLMQWRNGTGTLLGRITDIGNIVCPRISVQIIEGSPVVNSGTLFLLDGNHSINAIVGQGLLLSTFAISSGIFLQQVTGYVGINKTSSLSAMLDIVNRANTDVGLRVKGAVSQSGNLTEWQNSSGSILARVGIEGAFYGTVYNGTTYSMSAHYSGGFAMGPSAAISFGNSTFPTTGIQSSITFDSPNFSTVGAVALRSGTNTQFFRVYNTFTDASNYIRQSLSFTTYSSTVHAQLAAEGAGTGAVNVPFVITPRGTGAFILGPMPDGTATGGNARGQNAVDLQVVKTAASQVASGRYSFTVGYANTASGEGSGAGGYNTSATGFGAFSWGNACTTSGQYGITLGSQLTASATNSFATNNNNSAAANNSSAFGLCTTAWVQGMISFGSGGRYTNPQQGDQHGAILPILGWSAGPAAIELRANATDRLTVPTRCAFGFTVEIFGVKNKAGQAAFFHRQGIIKNIAGTTSLTGTIQTIGTDINPASASVSITADDTNDSLKIECTQPTGEFTGATGDSSTDIITLVGHPFINGDEVCFSSLTGGTGLAINTRYFVRDVSGNTFKLTTSFVGNTAIDFSTNITAATMDYIWYWHGIVKLSRINFGLY